MFFEAITQVKSSIYLEHKFFTHRGKSLMYNRKKLVDKTTKKAIALTIIIIIRVQIPMEILKLSHKVIENIKVIVVVVTIKKAKYLMIY